MTLNNLEERVEWNCIYQERLGMLCDDGDPTEEEKKMAKQDADEAVRKMRDEH